MRLRFLLATGVIFLAFAYIAHGRGVSDSLKPNRRPVIIALPIVYYTPDTRWGFGAAANYSFFADDISLKKSNISIGLSFTQNRQAAVYLPFQIFLSEDKYWLYGELGFYDYLYYFFGIGNFDHPVEREKYSVKFPRVRISALYEVAKSQYAGVRYVYDCFSYRKYDEFGQLKGGEILGSRDGQASGLGLLYNRDSRDLVQYPSKGSLLEALFYMEGSWLGSAFEYLRISLDYSHYIPMQWNNSILALDAVLIHMNGAVPFHQMSTLGGTKRLRGYFDGRFRNKQLQLLQAEFRTPIFWRFKGVVFSGIGTVRSDYKNYFQQPFVYHVGAGVRFEIDRSQKLHLRIDYGIGKDESGYYITIGEAF